METKSLTKKLKDFTTSAHEENIGATQRVISVVSGAYMLWSAISHITSKKKTGVIAPIWNVVSGGYLIYRGVSGYCPIKDSFRGPQNKIVAYLHKN